MSHVYAHIYVQYVCLRHVCQLCELALPSVWRPPCLGFVVQVLQRSDAIGHCWYIAPLHSFHHAHSHSAPNRVADTHSHPFTFPSHRTLSHSPVILTYAFTFAPAAQSPLRTLDVLGAVVLAEVDHALAAHLPSVFSPGVPPAFHTNYLAAQVRISLLVDICAHPHTYVSCFARWWRWTRGNMV